MGEPERRASEHWVPAPAPANVGHFVSSVQQSATAAAPRSPGLGKPVPARAPPPAAWPSPAHLGGANRATSRFSSSGAAVGGARRTQLSTRRELPGLRSPGRGGRRHRLKRLGGSGRCCGCWQDTDAPLARQSHVILAYAASAAATTTARPNPGGARRTPAIPETLRAARTLAARPCGRRRRREEEEAARDATLQLLALRHPEEAPGTARPGLGSRHPAAPYLRTRPAPALSRPWGDLGHVLRAPAGRLQPHPSGIHRLGDLGGGGGWARRRHALLLEPHPRSHPGHPEAPPGEAVAGATPKALPRALG